MGGVVIFSLFMLFMSSLLMLFSGDLMMYWMLLEISTLCLVPLFFGGGGLSGLLSYLVVSSLSSILIMVGLVFSDVYLLFVFGLCVKFGLFPFIYWVYNVLVYSGSWLVCWVISILSKISLVYLVFFLWDTGLGLVSFLAVLSLLVVGLNFWVSSLNWYYVWCHMMISSSVIMFVLGLIISMDLYIVLLVVYFVWGSGVIYYLSSVNMTVFGYVLWLLAVPLSISLYYKIYTCYLLCSSLYLLFFWFIYSFLEQYYLIKWVISNKISKFCFLLIV
uniref:NADH dehydrogenase subunit 2 n=1 Tax=Trichobilharzia regenti TaxID=157069 RepID=A7J1L1_TRIRE|nr:NADH dehydrogenase subunit 2 [Trichobilharzia regenti]ABG91500.1 NADH dehydrogenase subunit 2 [Trichobilharzia regenti]